MDAHLAAAPPPATLTGFVSQRVGPTDIPPVPVGTRVLHIGPHKTGTTTVQYAFHAVRRELSAQRVFYPGPTSQPMFAVYAVTGRMPAYMERAPIARWNRLIRAVSDSTAERAVISSEGLCDADTDAIRRIVRDLDPARVHVVVTLRPLADLLGSQWQQSIQDGRTEPFDSWLERVFNDPQSPAARMFWHRHRHDQLVQRWADVVGPERLTVVVVDEQDHEGTLRVFERLVGLRHGTLRAQGDRTNRSLTVSEIELVRALNGALTDAGLDPELRVRFVRDGVAELLRARTPARDELRIRTPAWARERAFALGREIVAGIGATGVRVVGDLERLGRTPRGRSSSHKVLPEAAFDAPAQIAATAPLGVLIMAGLARDRARTSIDRLADTAPISTTTLRRVLAGRARRLVARRLPVAASVARQLRKGLRAVRPGRPLADEDPP